MHASRHDAASNSSAAAAIKAGGVKAAIAASCCALALLVAAPTGASAFQANAAERAACTGDVFRLCASSVPNVNRIVACLDRQRPQLTPACRAVFQARMPARTATRSIAATKSDWCVFERGEQRPGEEMWQTWCRGRDQ